MKKLVIVLDFYESGGATRLMEDLSKTVDRRDVVLLCGTTKELENTLEKKENFSLTISFPLKLYASNLMHSLTIFWKTLIATKKLSPYLNSQTRIFCSLPNSGLAIALSPFCWKAQKHYVFSGSYFREIQASRTIPLPSIQQRIKIRIVDFWLWAIQKICLIRSSKIVVLSKYAQSLAISDFGIRPSKTVLSSPTLNVHAYNSKPLLGLRKQYAGKNTFIFYVASRIEKRKGLDLVIDAAIELNKMKKTKSYKIIFSGQVTDAMYEKSLKMKVQNKRLQNHVLFIHELDRTGVFDHYRACDAVLMPSIDLETLGLVTLEALLHSRPVIGFNSGATPEILRYVKSFPLCINSIHATSLAATMHQLLNLTHHKQASLQKESRRAALSFLNSSNRTKLKWNL